MKKFTMLFVCLVMLGVHIVNAQQKTITGTVTSSEDGMSLPGVSVSVKGTTVGTITNINGQYSFDVSADAKMLVFSFVGMKTTEVAIGATAVIDVVMEAEIIGVDEVVVTALGIKRSEKTLGYAATTVSSEKLSEARNTNVTSSLQGRVAGVQIQATSTDPGSASSVIIRGFSSINGSNQPLYVVDGVPLQNNDITTQGSAINTSGISNISSSDIESMTVLKGAAATALYGSRAANGIIVITTKQGKKGTDKNFSIQYNGGIQFRQISKLPMFQNEFGQGWNGAQTYIENGSWGPRLDGSLQVYGPIWNNQQLIHEYSAVEDNVKDFFDIGISKNHSLSLSGVSEDNKMNYFVSFSTADDNGVMPSDADTYKRNTIAYRTTYDATDWLTLSSSVNFARAEVDKVTTYQGTTVIDGLLEMPRDISIIDMKDLTSAFNTPEAYFTPYGITNPYWSLANNYNHTDSKQIYGKMQLDVKPMNDLTLTYRFGFDYSDYDRKIGYPEIELDDALIDDDMGYAPSNMNQAGWVYAAYSRSYELNHDFLASYNKNFGEFSLNASGGVNINERYSTSISGQTDGLSFDTGFWDLSNGATISSLTEDQSKRRLVGVLGDANVGFREMLFLGISARNDWSSTLPMGANSFFYSGATLSWIFSELIPKNNMLSFGKVRLAYGKTGNDASPYQTSTNYIQGYANGYYGSDIALFPMNSANAFLASTTAGSVDLRPEMTTETELGLMLKFYNGRIGLDAAYYNRVTNDQIFPLPIDPSSGYSTVVTNFGEVQNKGLELLLTTTPLKTNKVQWDVDFNLSLNRNKVLSMPESLGGGKATIEDFAAGNDAVYMYAEEGKPLGTFYTYLPTYVEDVNSPYYGNIIVDEIGQPILTDEVMDTGLDMNAKWTGGVNTTLSAYGFSLSATLDVRYGGHMFTRTKNLMQFTGNGIETLYNDRNPFIVPNSVQVVDDGSGNDTYVENTAVISISDGSYQNYFNDYGAGKGGEAYLIDRSFAKIRNITLTYNLPKKLIKQVKLSNVAISTFVNNAFMWTASDNLHIDPEVSTYGTDLAGQFGELYSNPSSRIYGFNLSITF
jgi:TonB-linked SusC/RagA family outer membrane protein